MKSVVALITLAAASLSAFAAPAPQQTQPFSKQNGIDAINQNNLFGTLTPNSSCQDGENACVNQQFAQCVSGSYVLQACANGLICASIPLVNSPGTSVTCTTQSDVDQRIAATGASSGSEFGSSSSSTSEDSGPTESSTSTTSTATTSTATATETPDSSNNNSNGNNGGNNNGGNNNNNNNSTSNDNNGQQNGNNNGGGDPQTSLCLEPNLVQTGYEQNGQETPAAGQVASLTSSNNYINFCGTVPSLPLTNGQQVKGGSCNAAPMGIIAASTNIPSAKFKSPKNLDKIPSNQNFTVKLQLQHLTAGNFVNAEANYFSAPQQTDNNGDVIGHSHIVIEAISSLTSTEVLDPTKFTFFKGLNDPAVNGVLSVVVAGGLKAGTYRMASINTAANHQPVLVAVAQHGSCDDMIYFTVTDN